MKANEFFKKVGIEAVKSYIVAYEDALTDDLKHLVESHELIESFGGLDLARKEAHKNCFEFNAPLLKAIYDVESCQ